MANLLLKLNGNRSFNRTIFPPYLYVYDDLLIYKKGRLLGMREITISYNQIARVTLNKGIIFGGLEIETTGKDDIHIKYVSKRKASQAKKIIDQKIYHAHAKHKPDELKTERGLHSVEKSINRLKELLGRGKISSKEFEKRKNELLKDLK